MSDFSDRPLVVGSLIGLRSFQVDTLGRLVGPVYGGIFKPGINEAECRKAEMERLRMATYPFSSLTWGGIGATSAALALSEEALAPRRAPKHDPGTMQCACGFYAYFDGSNDYKDPGRVTALISGHGITTVGSRGFRSGRAELVALVRRKPKHLRPHLMDAVERNYPGVPVFQTTAEAIKEHPLSDGHMSTPSTDDDFWTRNAS